MRHGPRNLITDVDGIFVGNAHEEGLRSGTTVILAEPDAVAAVDVRGGAPGTRETEALSPQSLVQIAHAICLSGGSAFGLDAASGVMSWLAARGRGFAFAGKRVPIVPTAVLFDLANGGDKDWGEAPPYRDLGFAAADAAGTDFRLGNAGAGFGATAGSLKGGLGSVSAVAEDGLQVGAIVAANAAGSVVIPGTGTLWAWPFEEGDELGGQEPPRARSIRLEAEPEIGAASGTNTTIGVVATNARLSRADAQRVAIMAQDGIARAIRPAHTPFDGDAIFVLATGRRDPAEPVAREVARIGRLAADCVARAVARGVYAAESLGEHRSYRDSHPRHAER